MLYRFSPRTALVVEKTLENMFIKIRIATHREPKVVAMRINNVDFQLCIAGGRPTTQALFAELAEREMAYEPIMTGVLTRLLRAMDEPAFMDVGAFMGYYACYVAALLGDRSSIFAVESNPNYSAPIEQSVRLNKFSNVRVFNAALSDKQEMVGIEGKVVGPKTSTSVLAMTITLDELCRKEGIEPNIVKIDVHGSEGKVLRGMKQLLKKSIDFVLMELHPSTYLDQYSGGITRGEILALLQGCGFTNFYVAGHRYEESDLTEFLDRGTFAYKQLNRETEEVLLFDRHDDVFILSSKMPDVASILGSSTSDPSLSG